MGAAEHETLYYPVQNMSSTVWKCFRFYKVWNVEVIQTIILTNVIVKHNHIKITVRPKHRDFIVIIIPHIDQIVFHLV